MKKIIVLLACLLLFFTVKAQEQLLNVARQYLLSGDYEKSAATFKQLLEYNPNDQEIIQGYLQSLIAIKEYAAAEKQLRLLQKNNPSDIILAFELARLHHLQGEQKKANKEFDKIISKLTHEDKQIRLLASRFEKEGFIDFAIQCFEKGKSFFKENPYLYAEDLALLYDKKGDTDRAIESLLDLYVSQNTKNEEIKSSLQRMMESAEKTEFIRKKVLKRISKEPEIMAYPDLLAWMYIQQDDYDNAFLQIKSIDTRLNEEGRRILGFARVALREKKFSSAIKAYDAVKEIGSQKPFYTLALNEKLMCLNQSLRNNPHYTPSDVRKVIEEYNVFLEQNPAYRLKETQKDLAELEARFANNTSKAIELLEYIVKSPQAERSFKARCKLDMGDYELLQGNIWESTLLYSQVDKEFKQDMLGEEARYKNARLSYYTGDFVWAQAQLDVLKASTSELIANDALNLSVLITENNPPADSNQTPLLMFARAELLEFQNKNEECIALLDSISALFPAHVLADNILMEKAKIAYKLHNYNEAAMHLQKIVSLYADDVLADDALYNLALINQDFFNNKEEALRLFEQLITNYAGSTFVNMARKRYRALRGDKPDVDHAAGFN